MEIIELTVSSARKSEIAMNGIELNLSSQPAETSRSTSRRKGRLRWLITLSLAVCSTGCTSLVAPLSGVPARRLPPQFFAEPKANLVPIDVSRLAMEPPRQYLLDSGDILGVYIEKIFPFTPPDQAPVLPPVNFPDKDSNLPPSVGYPVDVKDDGTIDLPQIRPLKVRGMTVEQVRDLVRREYLERNIAKEDENEVFTPIISLLRERTYSIAVLRQDIIAPQTNTQGAQGYTKGTDQSASGSVIKLKAGENDVLHALIASGGLPGVNARNEVKVMKVNRLERQRRDAFVQSFYSQFACNPNPCMCPPPLPDDPAVLKIPLRLPPGLTPNFRQEDIILEEGDILYIESRDADVFYTGGLLPGGEWKIPRDYDLDVLGAMAVAGAGVSSPNGGGGGGGGGMSLQRLGGVPPGMLYVLRKTPCNGQVVIEIDLAKALMDPRERPLVMPGDTLILRYKCEEEALNFGLAGFFTYGLRYLFQNN